MLLNRVYWYTKGHAVLYCAECVSLGMGVIPCLDFLMQTPKPNPNPSFNPHVQVFHAKVSHVRYIDEYGDLYCAGTCECLKNQKLRWCYRLEKYISKATPTIGWDWCPPIMTCIHSYIHLLPSLGLLANCVARSLPNDEFSSYPYEILINISELYSRGPTYYGKSNPSIDIATRFLSG